MTIETKLDQLDELLEEKKYRLNVLRLWRHAENNLDREVYNQIRSFTFCDGFLGKEKREINNVYMNAGMAAPYCGLNYHNAVRLNSGDLQEIPFIERPEIPTSIKTNIKKVY